MGSLRIFWYLFLFSLSCTFAFAEVNISYGEFKLQHFDHISSRVNLNRSYSSRSLYKGLFGYGWCSSWDFRKSLSTENQDIFLCQEKYLTKEKITFTRHGDINSIETQELEIIFIRNKLSINKTQSSKQKIFVYITDDLVSKIVTPKYTYSYQYTSKKLNRVFKSKTTVYRYEYDSYANMTKWQSASELEKMSYDSELDLIQSYTQKDLCHNTYNYSHLNKSKFILQERKCLSKTPQTIKYSFDYNKKKITIQILNSDNYRLGVKNEDTTASAL